MSDTKKVQRLAAIIKAKRLAEAKRAEKKHCSLGRIKVCECSYYQSAMQDDGGDFQRDRDTEEAEFILSRNPDLFNEARGEA